MKAENARETAAAEQICPERDGKATGRPVGRSDWSAPLFLAWWRRMIPEGTLRAQVFTLMSGMALAQALTVGCVPVLTRLYAPTDFAFYALFIVGTNLLTPIATGRYELALMLPEKDEDAVNVLVAALVLSATVSLLMFLGMLAVHVWPGSLLDLPGAGAWIWFVPAGVLVYSWCSIAAKWESRQLRFRRIACAEFGGCTGTLLAQVAAGILLASPNAIPLICGQQLGRAVAVAAMGKGVCKDLIRLRGGITLAGVMAAVKRYWRFPAFSTTGVLLGRASHEVPKLMLATCFGARTLGLFSLADRVAGKPLNLMGQATGNVLFPHISKHRHDAARSRALLAGTCRKLLILSFVPMLILFLWADWLFAFAFGEQWAPAGHYARLLIPMMVGHLLVAAIRNSMQAFEKQHVVFVWHASFLVLSLAAVGLGHAVGSAELAIFYYSLICMMMYGIYVGMCFYFARNCEEFVGVGPHGMVGARCDSF